MTDLELMKLCAEAMGLHIREIWGKGNVWVHEYVSEVPCGEHGYSPLTDDAQAMALVKRFDLKIEQICAQPEILKQWEVTLGNPPLFRCNGNMNLNRAICECVAKMQLAKNESKEA